MASIETPKARKEYVCSKCGTNIKVGEEYVKGTPFRMKPIIRCKACGLRHWELSSSDYIQAVGRVCDCWQEDYGIEEDTPQSIADELSTIRDDLQDRYDNLPENFQYSENGEMMQERIDNLDSAISDLENIDYENIKETVLSDNDYDDYDGLTDEGKEEVDENIKDNLTEEIESALSCLDY